MTKKEFKYFVDNLPLTDEHKESILENAGIFYEYLDFLSEKNPDIDNDVIEKTWDIKYKLMLEKKLETLDVCDMTDDETLDVGLDLMSEIAKTDGFDRYAELKEKTKILYKLLK